MSGGEEVTPRRRCLGRACATALALALSGCGGGGSGGTGPPPEPPVSPPPQPTGFAAEAGDSEVRLSWTAVASATRWDYRQRVGDGGWGAWTTVPDSGAGTTGHTVTDLDNGTAYGFQVRAVGAGGAGPASAEATATPVAPGVPVEIPDPNLRRVLESTLAKVGGEAITDVELRNLSELRASRRRIADLTGLEHATNLTHLELQGNEVSDLEPLSALAALLHLDLSRNRVSDLFPLAGLVSLVHLGLADNDVADLGPLSSLVSLARLELGPGADGHRSLTGEASNRVSDLEPLSALTALTHLDLSFNEVADISPLAGLAALVHLGLYYNEVFDLRPLSGLTSLAHLDLSHNRVSDLGPLSSLSSVTWLGLGGNRVSDLAPLSELASLAHLGLWGNEVTDISPLAGLAALELLALSNNDIVDVRPLSDLTTLTHLYLHGNGVANVSALRGLGSLEELTLSQNPISDMAPLAALTAMRDLSLYRTSVEDLSFVSGMEELTNLQLWHTPVGDLRPLAALKKLKYLGIGETAVDDLSPLANLASLQRLYIGNLSTDLRPLAELKSMTTIIQTGLNTSGALPKVDIAPLAGLTNLVSLWASPRYGDLSPLADLASLEQLHLPEPGTPFENPRVLEGLSELRELTLDRGGLEKIPPLAESAALVELDLEGNRIEDLAPLAGREHLRVLDLDHNRVVDIAALAANPGLGEGDRISLAGNPLGAVALTTHIPELEARGASVAYDRDDFPDSPLRVMRDEAVSMRVDADLDTVGRELELELLAGAEEFIAHFGDEFDVLLFLSALERASDHADLPYHGVFHGVSNDVRGIGLREYRLSLANTTRLRGLIHLPWLDALARGPALHELMHIWANFGVRTGYVPHWGFSSAAGQLGGFRLENLVDLGGGRWSAGSFATIANGGNKVPYSPWELYLGGFVGPEEVPDLWVAPEAHWTDERSTAGHRIFEAAEHSTLTVDEFIETHGPRVPDHASAPKELRGAVIVLEDDDHQIRHWDDLLEQVRWLSHPGPSAAFRGLYNYHEATGGRGRLVLDGLLELRRDTPLSDVRELRLRQVCPPSGTPAGIGEAALTAPAPAEFVEGQGPQRDR